MTLYIKKIVIRKNGKITQNLQLNKGLSVVQGSADLYDIILLIIGKHTEGYTFYNVEFYAEVEFDKIYYIRGSKSKGERLFNYAVFTKDDIECTDEYLESLKTNNESDASLLFHRFKRQDYPHKLVGYKDIFNYYPSGNFSSLTNGFGLTRSFRAFMLQYIKYFKPIRLHANSDLYVKLLPNGQFSVAYLQSDEKVCLSQGENVLYHFYSFISIADFWDRADRIRNMHSVKKPLVISAFLELIDQSIDLNNVLKKINRLGRQTIMFSDKEKIPTQYDIKGEYHA